MSTNKSSDHPDAPPSYAVATGSSASSQPHANTLQIPEVARASRKSMEDEERPLPHGWVRQWDMKEQHQFFVNTTTDPPRSIWVHPMDDKETWDALSSDEKERLQAEEERLHRPRTPTDHKPTDHKDEKSGGAHPATEHYPADLPPRPAGPISQPSSSTQSGKKKGFTERLKDKVTGMTHEEREQERIERAEAERQYYEMHARFRTAMTRAQATGQPQWFAKDKNGQDIYIEPPTHGYGGYPNRGYGYNPYTAGPYSAPNARYIRPQYGYGRPGYGGAGMGLPIAGGLLGGALLGGLLF